jgi:regulator of cell morphogenesis and NO signaling
MTHLIAQDNPALGLLLVSGADATMNAAPTVRQLVSESPRRARVFEKYGIPFCCCGGNRTVVAACAERGIESGKVQSELKQCDEAKDSPAPECLVTDWLEVPLGNLVSHIQQVHHASLLAELPRLSYLANRVASRHGELYPELWDVQSLLADFRQELETHIANEERVFLPLCQQLADETPLGADGSIANTICVLEMEHTFLNETVSAMLDAVQSSVPPEEACNSYRVLVDGLKMLAENFRQCVCEENEMLFPRALFVSQCTVTATS